jgi:hypothetical protein
MTKFRECYYRNRNKKNIKIGLLRQNIYVGLVWFKIEGD